MNQSHSTRTKWQWLNFGAISLLVVPLLLALAPVQKAGAIAKLVQVQSLAANGTTVSATLSPAAKKNHLLVIICAARTVVAFTTPAGFTAAKSELTVAPVQAIYYKVAVGGETTFSCAGGGTARRGIQLYEYSGTATTSPLEAVNAVTSTGSTATPSSGSVTTTSANTLLIAGVVMVSSGTGFSAWSNTFTERADFTSTARFGGADRYATTAGTYSTVATNSAASKWRGQIAAFKLLPIALSADIVDASNVSVVTPSISFANMNFNFACQSNTATLGVSAQQVRVFNTTSTATWTLSIAATSGAAALWTNGGTRTYDFNDPTGTGCNDGADGDSVGGQLSVNPTVATITPDASCSNTGVTAGASTAFNQGVTDSIVLATGSASAEVNCMWNITGIGISQKIPAEQSESSYSIGLTMTLVAS